jgi:hypothetical protein
MLEAIEFIVAQLARDLLIGKNIVRSGLPASPHFEPGSVLA